MENIKEKLIDLLKKHIDGIESELENTYETLKIREEILDFLNKNKDIEIILATKMDDLKDLIVKIFGEKGKQNLAIERINFIYEGSKICDDLPQLNAAKKELTLILDELRRKIRDYDNEIERIEKNNEKIIDKTKIYRKALISLEENKYLKNSQVIADMILNSDLKESEMYQYILYLTKINTIRLEGKEDVEEFHIKKNEIEERDYLNDYFDIIKDIDFSYLDSKNILPLKNLDNFSQIKGTLLVLFENEINSLKKQLSEQQDSYIQRKLEEMQKNFQYLKEYSDELKVKTIKNNQLIYKLSQAKNTIIMEDFRKENFEKKDFKDIIELLKDFKMDKVKKTAAFNNKLINTYKITKNNVNIIIINVKEDIFVAIKLYRFGSLNVEKDVLERLNHCKNELEYLIDELNHPVQYKELMDSNENIEKAIFDTLILNAKVG